MKRYGLFLIILFFMPLIVSAEETEIIKIDYTKKTDTVIENKAPSIDGLNVSINNTFFYKNESIVYKVDIKNNTSSDYVISKIPESNYINYELDFGNNDRVIKAYETKTLLLTVKYEKEIPEELFKKNKYEERNFYQLKIIDKNIINPPTGNGVIFLITIIVIIIIFSVIVVKQKNKKIIILIMTGFMAIPIFSMVKVSAQTNTNIIINSNIVIEKPIVATFLPGPEINDIMNEISEEDEMIYTYGSEDYKTMALTGFKRSKTLDVPISEATVVSTSDSEASIYMWYKKTDNKVTYMDADWGTFNNYSESVNYEPAEVELIKNTEQIQENIIYWYSDANIVYLNEDSSYFFQGFTYLSDINDLNQLNASKVQSMEEMFSATGMEREKFIVDISNWNTSSLTNMKYMFSDTGFDVDVFHVDLSKWDVSNIQDFSNIFVWTGEGSKEVSVGDLSNWDVSNATSMSAMFEGIGMFAYNFNLGDLSKWDVSNVTNMSWMFDCAGEYSRNWYVGDLSNWDTSNVVDMHAMFQYTGELADDYNIGNIGKWNTSKVQEMDYMFAKSGINAKKWYIGDLSKWDVSNVIYMSGMFEKSGKNAAKWSVGDLSNWNTKNVKYMSKMFHDAGKNAITWESIGTLNIYADSIYGIFYDCNSAKATINIYSNPEYSYTENSSLYGKITYTSFYGAATIDNALITVNYSNATTNIDDIIATKSENSHVVKGSLLD